MKTIRVNLGTRSYNILIGAGILANLSRQIKKLNIGLDALVITNPVINKKYSLQLRGVLKSGGFTVKTELVPDSETSKSQGIALRLIDRIVKYDMRKRLFIIALGGGVVGDVSGFVASVYKRGVPYIQIPTTLLAQVDSSIGGKVAIDLDSGKNLVGSFYQPRFILSDIKFLKSLGPRQLISGLAEVIKYSIISDPKLFTYLKQNYKKILRQDMRALEHIVYECAEIKARVIEKDEKETKGIRTILNYGHTIGHAIEATCGYQKTYTHGEAIAIGMVLAARIACSLNILNRLTLKEIEDLIIKVGLPTKIRNLNQSRILTAIYHDKKFIFGANRFVLPKRIGRVIVYDGVPLGLIKQVISEAKG